MLVKNKLLTYAGLAVAVAMGGAFADRSMGQPTAAPQISAQISAQIGPWGFDLTGVDPKAKPGDSFFDYANGAWDARTVIPPDKTNYGMFVALRDKVEEQVQTIIHEP